MLAALLRCGQWCLELIAKLGLASSWRPRCTASMQTFIAGNAWTESTRPLGLTLLAQHRLKVFAPIAALLSCAQLNRLTEVIESPLNFVLSGFNILCHYY